MIVLVMHMLGIATGMIVAYNLLSEAAPVGDHEVKIIIFGGTGWIVIINC